MNDSEPLGSALKDPVCGMEVDRETTFRTTYEGEKYFFCSEHCLTKFTEDPKQYLESIQTEAPAPVSPEEAESVSGALYTCPMHPEVRQDKPGICLKCGMALEPAGAPAAPLTKTEWVCPMHSEVVQGSPGNCPKCGMALEPMEMFTATAPGEDTSELDDLRRRFWVGLVFTVPVFLYSMAEMAAGHHGD